MIRPLRQRHRLIVTVLAIALVILFVSALLARKPFPTVNRLPQFQPAAVPDKGGAR